MDFKSIAKFKRKPPPPPAAKPAHLSNSVAVVSSSQKRGIGWPWDYSASLLPLFYNNNNHDDNSGSNEKEKTITWLFNWELWVPPGLPSTNTSSSTTTTTTTTVEWIPCIRTASQVGDIIPFLTDIITNQNRPVTALLGFNEPEIPSQANLDVKEAIRLWREFVIPAKKKFGLRLGSPGMSSDVGRSKPWLDGFLAGLKSNKEEEGVDFLVLHWYGPRFSDMKNFLEDMYRTYQKPVWVNEFACSSMGNGEVGEKEVLAFMGEALPWLDRTEWIERYAYYGNGQGRDVGQWVGRANNFIELAAGSEETDGRRLSKVGRFYLGMV